LIEDTMDDAVVEKLQALGHRVRRSRVVGITQAVSRASSIMETQDRSLLHAVHDPRVPGLAQGWDKSEAPDR
ncbi:MAG: hypothetical protein VXZ49_03225, partial [Planctomycetota bacterium]|nr:hypothetical protein [Planctomycetota bacterium]